MDITSLGYRTDLALLQLGGSVVRDRGDHLVVRTSHNPSFWWGNFLLLPQPPPVEEVPKWLDAFEREFPEAQHVALGFDGVVGSVADLAGFAAAGLTVEGSTVMSCQSVHAAPHPNESATYRSLRSDKDWAQQVELRVACIDDRQDPSQYRAFAEAKAKTMRGLTEAGHGSWFGAFLDGQLACSMGLFTAGTGIARFQSVETHPDARGRGLAGTLVHFVSRFGFDAMGARTLVMVADPEYSAIRIYRSVGFSATETQLQAERPPALLRG